MRGGVTRLIRAELDRDPSQRNKDIAVRLGVKAPMVSTVRQRFGYPVKYRRSFRKTCSAKLQFSQENAEFLADEAERHGLSLSEILNAIITDVRCEDA